jgi:hypothetical protein
MKNILSIVFISCILLACKKEKTTAEKIYGTWTFVSMKEITKNTLTGQITNTYDYPVQPNSTYEFKNDGTYVFKSPGNTATAQFTPNSDNWITFGSAPYQIITLTSSEFVFRYSATQNLQTPNTEFTRTYTVKRP